MGRYALSFVYGYHGNRKVSFLRQIVTPYSIGYTVRHCALGVSTTTPVVKIGPVLTYLYS